MDFKIFEIFQYNGKDLFLKGKGDQFIVKSFQEIPHEFREFAVGWTGREVKLYKDGSLELIKTPQEIQRDADRRQRHLAIRRDIAGLENMKEGLNDYQQCVLDKLRLELVEYEDVDPTAKTLEQQRANESIVHEDHKPKKVK